MDSIAIPRRARQGRILIADDDQAIVGLLERILARAGFADLTVTTDSASVGALYSEISPDVTDDLRLTAPLHDVGFDSEVVNAFLAVCESTDDPLSTVGASVLTIPACRNRVRRQRDV